MGRPEPCVLFAQTFVHPQLDEYVDEVIFADPIVITACEFLEQNSSSASSAVTLLGATSPPSFALEVFVQCEGEARFRRLCQPFLYSYSSSNVLEVEAVVTNHLVVRGSYRSLSLVIYGNTAEDLGQFNIEFDLDSSLANLVSSTEAKLEDLPPVLHTKNPAIEDSIFSLKTLPSLLPLADISVEIKKFLQLAFKLLDSQKIGDSIHKTVPIVASAASSFFSCNLVKAGFNFRPFNLGRVQEDEQPLHVFIEARKNLLDNCRKLSKAGYISADFLEEYSFIENDLVTSKELVEMLFRNFQFKGEAPYVRHPQLSQSENVMLWLSLALLLCSGREGCFHFVNGGGMEQLKWLLGNEMHRSSAFTLMLLAVIEQVTRYAVGCEGFLGWWPREDETVPVGISEGYSQLLKLLMLKHRHDVASLATYILHRLRTYEVASRYEHAVLSLLGRLSAAGTDATVVSNVLSDAKLQLRRILKLISSFGTIEDPSPIACVGRSLILAQADESLSYEVTSKLIASSSCWFFDREIDSQLLSLLNERGFLPLSLALLSSPKLRAGVGQSLDAFLDIKSSIETIILSCLFCRSGLVFLLYHPELSSTILHALKGASDMSKEDCIPLRYAFGLISKGFFCHAHEVGMIVEMHLRVVSAVDRLLTSSPCSEEFLWVLWELCRLSRSHCGHQALLSLGHFPEAIQVLIEALHSVKESEQLSLDSGTPLNLAIFHSAAEIFEAIVNDPISSSLGSWIEHAMELHKALHLSSPGSNRKDAPTRLLDWIDAGVVYHKKGAIGLLHYAAVLASGGDAHMTATSILVADAIVVENAEGDPSSGPEVNVVESLLGKLVSEKSFDGVVLRDSSVAQLTTAFRILALISEIPEVASLLYDGSAVTIVYVVLINCRLMFERLSNNYDYLVDDGTECNSTSDLLLERNREKCLIDLLIPSLVLLIELLHKLKEAKEQHRNTKLMKSLLRLHLELSPKLATCAVNLSTHPDSVLGMEAVCHLIASALACWPVNAWDPGLFHTLLDNFHATSLLALGPKEACSLLCLLIDLLPEEGVLLWKNGIPSLTALRSLAVGTLLGPQKERQVNWYLQSVCVDVLLGQLMPHLDKISRVILHFTVSTLTVGQDMLRVLIIRIGCQQVESACVLLRPILSWIQDHLLDTSSLEETDTYKAYKILDFLSCLLEHPFGKLLLLKEGALQMLEKLLVRCIEDDWLQEPEFGKQSDCGFKLFSCCLPILKSISLICNSHFGSHYVEINDRQMIISAEDYTLIFHHVFKLCQVLPVGRELVACLEALKELVSSAEGQRVLVDIFLHIQSSNADEALSGVFNTGENSNTFLDVEWRKQPLLCCWITLYKSVEKNGPSIEAIEAVTVLCLGALRFGLDGRRVGEERVAVLKNLFGISDDMTEKDAIPEDEIKYIQEMFNLLSSQFANYEHLAMACTKAALHQAIESVKLLSLLLLKPSEADEVDDVISRGVALLLSIEGVTSRIHLFSDGRSQKVEDDFDITELGERFHWEYPENLRNRLSQAALPGKRKLSSDGTSRHGRGDNSPAEVQSIFQRGSGPSVASSGPTRRDTFRQRKPNTSRPPSMHVDDYVARERNADVATNSNVIAVPRIGSSGGRPPSIHVDEFMARQRERQNTIPMAVVDTASQGKIAASGKELVVEKSDRSRQLKVDLDDDLQGIDIVLDGEESEPDDKLPFPQPDDNLQHAGLAAAEQSPRSIVEETDNDLNDMGVPVSSIDEKAQSELSTRMSVSHPNMALTREPSISSDKKYLDHPDELKSSNAVATPGGLDSSGVSSSSGFSASAHNNRSAFSRTPPHNMYPPGNLRRSGNIPVMGSQGYADQKFLSSQPPLPPTPPPPTISPLRSQGPDSIATPSSPFVNSMADMHPSFSHAYHAQTDPHPMFSSVSTSLASVNHMLDLRYPRMSPSFSGGSSRPLPPLPPTPPPFSAAAFNVQPQTSTSPSAYHQSGTATNEFLQASTAFPSDSHHFANHPSLGSRPPYATNLVMSPSMFSRPSSVHVSHHGNIPAQHQGDNLSIPPNISTPHPSMQSIQPLTQLQPLQPPKLPCPRLPIQGSQLGEQGGSLLQSNQMQVNPQVLQQSQVAQFQVYYRPQQQEDLSLSQLQAPSQQSDGAQRQQQDSTLTLQQYFSSPEAIQSLVSDRDKLCQLLEQHPKLMQMLQERLGHL